MMRVWFYLVFSSALMALSVERTTAQALAFLDSHAIVADTPAELQDAYLALSSEPGGGTIRLAPNFPATGEISLRGGGRNPVHVTSTDPEKLVQISRIACRGLENVSISNVYVNSIGVERPDHHRDIDIYESARIEITGSVFVSNASLVYPPGSPDGVIGERLGMIRDSQEVTILDNSFARYEHGLTFWESSQIRVISNEFTAIQGDGIRLVGVREVLIADNYMHDFASVPNEFTHSDFIQLWSRHAETASRDITVTGNVFDTGNGVSAQGIWMRNEAYDHGETDEVYRNITITDNLIYTGAANGIGIGQADNVLIANNTLLWNRQAVTTHEDRGDTSFFPRIRLHEDATNVLVIDNIVTRILHGRHARLEGNVLLSWDPADPNFAGRHFVNVARGGDIGPQGWRLQETSPWIGRGSSFSQPGGPDPR